MCFYSNGTDKSSKSALRCTEGTIYKLTFYLSIELNDQNTENLWP